MYLRYFLVVILQRDEGRLVAAGSVDSRGSMKDLLEPPMRITSVLLWLIWFACAFAYYGIVLMTTEILQEMKEGTCDADDQCSFNCQDLGRVRTIIARSILILSKKRKLR